MAVVRERGYAHWDGRLAERRFRWLPITRTGIRLAFRKKGFKLAFASAFLPAFVALGGLYMSERLEDFKSLVQSNRALLRIDPAYFQLFLTGFPLYFLLIVILSYAGAGLISEDLKHNALQLYFARPLSKKDYVLGKMSVVAFFVTILTGLPWILLVVFKLIFAGNLAFLASYPWLPLSIIGHAALLTLFFGSYVLLLSASSRNTRYVIVLVFGVFYFSSVLSAILGGIFRSRYMFLFSLPENLRQAGAALFGGKLPHAVPAGWSFLVLAGICGLAAAVLGRKVRSVEVIK
jgi:ABC-type transport system involved in multi-copper enzyme maturation permease subunit